MKNTLLKMGFEVDHSDRPFSTLYHNNPFVVQQHREGWSIKQRVAITNNNDRYEILFRGISASELIGRLYILFRDNFTDDLVERILLKNGFTKEGGYSKGPWRIFKFSTGGWQYDYNKIIANTLTFQVLMDNIVKIHQPFVEEPQTINLDQLKISNLNYDL